ncbi:MBL fold metallo-hydrolase [Labrys okinawensis]|uniref:MBL fold metallo-hydrolase n=1 Tax=Labrys okinawensis TaxID=346911 RepID=A0A2S9Q918_9HYPH|nr:MBL fold metallo-hydrolase [Labrys okinawensis]PRH85841.1 MBL fold metallo-hydrolase [Labrys okinawensis]
MLKVLPFAGPLVGRLANRPEAGLSLYWLGQAGFLLDSGRHRLLIDPYLSNSLAEKYRDRGPSHERMMPPPIEIDELPPLDLILCTHHHTDHLDAATLAPLARRFAQLRLVVPKASLKLAQDRTGLGPERFIGMDAGETLVLDQGIEVSAVRAAHEELQRDEQGRHLFLGYALGVNGIRVFHSGDTIPFVGQIEEVRALAADLALLPVNGRSPALAAAGIAGNFTLEEAVELASACGIPAMLAHHYGLFAFNTLAPERIDARAMAMAGPTRLLRARTGIEYRLIGPAGTAG